MKIIVAIKRVLDHNIEARVKADHSDVELTNAKMAMNPFCEIAVEEAVRLKEKGVASEVLAVTIGPKSAQEQLRAALALGADSALHIESDERVDSLAVARLLAKVVEREQPGLVLLGKQAIDTDNSQTGPMLAALMGMPQATFASQIVVEGESVLVKREVDGGSQTLELDLPAIVTTDLRLNEPRYAKLPDIMKAKKKPLETTTPAELGVDISTKVRMLKVEPPAERKGGIKVGTVDELVDKLKNEAKVL